jgi:5-methylcytosine-specific restriction endonuclease McrA
MEGIMDNEKYKQYLQSDKWKAISKRRYEIDGYRCCMCGCTGTPANRLEIHHLSYRYLYYEENRVYEDLVTLCHICHKQLHKAMERTTSATGRKGWKDSERIPQVHVFDLGGQIEYKAEEVRNELKQY